MSAASDPIDTYLAQLCRCLDRTAPAHGLGRASSTARAERDEIIAEIHDGLLEARAAYQRRELTPTAAAAHAVSEFGDPATLARSLQPDLLARHSRRIAQRFLATGPVIGVLWLATAAFSHLGARLRDPDGVVLAARLILGLTIITGIAAAALAIAATGRLNRWITIPARLPASAVATTAMLAAAIDAIVLTALLAATLTTPESVPWAVALAAATASSTRLILATREARRLIARRRTLE